MEEPFREQLEQLRSSSLFRSLKEISSPQGLAVSSTGRELLNFSSNDYLGLANDPLLRDAAKTAIDRFGLGAGASRLICGTLSPHLRLEEKLAFFKRTEAALCFSTGYAAALGTIGALVGPDDVIVMDKLAHACLIDGARLSGAKLRVFPHNNLAKLEHHLEWARKQYPNARTLVITESVFSMDGDCAPLADIVRLKKAYGAMLLVDEAHAVGVLGENGRGLADALNVGADVDVQMGTLSKALGASGGYVCGSRALIDLLINKARSFIFSTAPSPAIAAAAEASLDFLLSPEGQKRIQDLWLNLKTFSELVPQAKRIESAIAPIILGDEKTTLDASQALQQKGFLVPAIRYPTVAKKQARLRITVSARHSQADLVALSKALFSLGR